MLPSPSTRRVWIEIGGVVHHHGQAGGHPPRGGCGLKSLGACSWKPGLSHPPRGGCGLKYVAPGVLVQQEGHPPRGGCGLKCLCRQWWTFAAPSPSTRRVWIEISACLSPASSGKSHPPRGGCGLKFICVVHLEAVPESPSTRRVWIEIHAFVT